MCHPWQPGLEASWHINVAGVGKFETLLNSKTYQISDRSGRGRGEPGESTCWCCVLMLSLVCGVMLISGRCRQPCNEMLMWRHGILSVLQWLLACSVGKWNYLNVCRCSWYGSEVLLLFGWRWHRDNAGPMLYAFSAAIRGLLASANENPVMMTPDQWEARSDTGSVVCRVNIVITPHTSISTQCQHSHIRPGEPWQPGLSLVYDFLIRVMIGWWIIFNNLKCKQPDQVSVWHPLC